MVFIGKSYVYIYDGIYWQVICIYIYIYIYMTIFEQNFNNLKMAAIARNM